MGEKKHDYCTKKNGVPGVQTSAELRRVLIRLLQLLDAAHASPDTTTTAATRRAILATSSQHFYDSPIDDLF